jgi:hypothetical protein
MRCFRIHSSDNVTTMLDDAASGTQVQVLGAGEMRVVASREPIALGHKIALRDIAAGEAILKFGVTIGEATCAITAGQWVHLHNCASNFDRRSQTLDLHSGSATDTKYE